MGVLPIYQIKPSITKNKRQTRWKKHEKVQKIH